MCVCWGGRCLKCGQRCCFFLRRVKGAVYESDGHMAMTSSRVLITYFQVTWWGNVSVCVCFLLTSMFHSQYILRKSLWSWRKEWVGCLKGWGREAIWFTCSSSTWPIPLPSLQNAPGQGAPDFDVSRGEVRGGKRTRLPWHAGEHILKSSFMVAGNRKANWNWFK